MDDSRQMCIEGTYRSGEREIRTCLVTLDPGSDVRLETEKGKDRATGREDNGWDEQKAKNGRNRNDFEYSGTRISNEKPKEAI